MLSSVDWEQLIDPTDVNQSLLTWENYFMNVMESCIPKGILPKRKNLPWLSKNIRRAMQKRNNVYKKGQAFWLFTALEKVQNNEKQGHNYVTEF